MTEAPTLDAIYDACNAVDSGESKDYSVFIAGTKSPDVKVKKLSAQMIVRYWKSLSEQRKDAFSALTSLLVDPDPETRKAVLREMSHLVKVGLLVEETANVFSELLQLTDRPDETAMMSDLLVRFLKSYPKEVLGAVFKNIVASKEEPYRICLLKFISTHLPEVPATLLTDDLKKLIEEQYREILRDVTAAEFDLIFDTLKSMEHYKSVKGRLSLYKLVIDQIDIDQPLLISDVQRCDQVLYFAERAQTLLSVNCRSTDLVNFLISGLPDLRTSFPGLRNRYLRAIADLMPFAATLDDSRVMEIFVEFMTLIPLMPSENGESVENKSAVDEKTPEHELKLSELEALGIALNTIFKSNKTIFQKIRTGDFEVESEKNAVDNWLKRMLYLARLLQQYITAAKSELKTIRETPAASRDADRQKSLENSVKKAENVLKIAKDFCHTTPVFAPVLCSWKNASTVKPSAVAVKHKLGDSNSSTTALPEKKGRPAPDVYVPPSGKYSSTFAGKSVGRTFRGGARGRRGRY